MPTITDFPLNYPRTRERVREVEIIGHLTREEWEADPYHNPDYVPTFSNFDFFVKLNDGRVYGFTASLPEFIRAYMERENEDSFVSPGLVLVRRTDVASVLHAVEEWLDQESLYGLGHYGILQVDLDE